ncbi:MAG: ThuA domain-containing protein [Planctomycetes bacterium]|nr:ThuA domain-containing protein [Planctomycetota bacterium]
MDKIKTLLYAGGIIHDFKACGDEAEKILIDAGAFDITRVDDDLSCLEAPNLDPYDLVVFYHTMGEITDAQKNGLLNWVAGGKAYAGIHSAADSFRECPEYRAMVGGHFVTHPAYREYQVSVVDGEHPITEGLSEFNVTDEQYITDYDPRVNVLASALWQGDKMPVVWTKEWGKGKVFYLALGHDGNACKQEVFGTLLVRGCQWAAANVEASE